MTRDRALVFDLDETLYRERRFALGGFAAVSELVASEYGVLPREAFGVMALAMRRGRRPAALQDLCARFDFPESILPRLVECYRSHPPRLRLSPVVARVLRSLRPDWRLGLLTNGHPGIQARKVGALGLGALLDCVVFAAEHGCGRGKPEPAPFREVLSRLGVDSRRAVFVGDDPTCDVFGARRVGLATIRVRRRGIAARLPHDADVLVDSIDEVPAAAQAVLHGELAYAD